jgi:branched-chain amino acid transport system substrate-binding protein
MNESENDIQLGILLGFTGPIESLTPAIADGAELAIAEVNESGGILGGRTVTPVRADTTCIDAAAAVAAGQRLIDINEVSGFVGAVCSPATTAILSQVARPSEVVMISPASTASDLTTEPDNGLFFRTVPSDARQGEVMAERLLSEGIDDVAIAFVADSYGSSLANGFRDAFEAGGAHLR